MDFKQVIEGLGLELPRVFVETGTFQGQGIERARPHFPRITSIEIKKSLSDAARQKYQTPQIMVIEGDSPEVLKGLQNPQPVFFHLDAYWHGGSSLFGVREDLGTALLRELRTLAERPYPDIIWIENLRNLGQVAKHTRKGMEEPSVVLNWTHLTPTAIQDSYKPGYRFHPIPHLDILVAFPAQLGNLTET
jgi:hypothetical protein